MLALLPQPPCPQGPSHPPLPWNVLLSLYTHSRNAVAYPHISLSPKGPHLQEGHDGLLGEGKHYQVCSRGLQGLSLDKASVHLEAEDRGTPRLDQVGSLTAQVLEMPESSGN